MLANIRRVLNSIGGWLMSGEVLMCAVMDQETDTRYNIFTAVADKDLSLYLNDDSHFIYLLYSYVGSKVDTSVRSGGFLPSQLKTNENYKYINMDSIGSTYGVNYYYYPDSNRFGVGTDNDSVVGDYHMITMLAIPRTDV